MVICSNRFLCGNITCQHRKPHKYVKFICQSKLCIDGHYCTKPKEKQCGRKRECEEEFVDIVKNVLKKEVKKNGI